MLSSVPGHVSDGPRSYLASNVQTLAVLQQTYVRECSFLCRFGSIPYADRKWQHLQSPRRQERCAATADRPVPSNASKCYYACMLHPTLFDGVCRVPRLDPL